MDTGYVIEKVKFLMPLFEALLKASLLFPDRPVFQVYALNRKYVGKFRRIA